MTETTADRAAERSVALLIGDDVTGMDPRTARIPANAVQEVRQKLAALRMKGAGLPPGERVDVVAVIGRRGCRPIVVRLNAAAAGVEELWSLIEGMDR